MRIIIANLFIFGFLWLLYYLNAFALFENRYMSWFAPLLVISVFVIGFKIIGSPFNVYGNDDDDDEKKNEDYDDDNNTSRKKRMKNRKEEE